MKNKRVMKFAMLGVLSIVLIVVVYIQFLSRTPSPEGALRVVKCSACGDQVVKRIKDINDSRDSRTVCAKCSKPMGYAYKCNDCDFEFPVIPVDKPPAAEMAKMKTMGKFNYVLQMSKCPNCGSTRTTPMSVVKK